MINLQDMIIKSGLYNTFKVDDVLFVQYQCFAREESAPVWSHNNYLAYALGGKKMWRTNRKDYTISSGEALFIRKGAHTVYQYFDETFYVIFVFLPDDFIFRTLKKYPDAAVHPSTSGNINEDSIYILDRNLVIDSFFQSLISYFLETKPPQPALIRLKMEELIINLLTLPGNDSLKRYLAGIGNYGKTDMQEIMERYYTEHLSIRDYARLCARSLSAFRRDFKHIFGTTPGKWLMGKRMAYSRLLLESSDKTIGNIADECGFINRSHFTRSFREMFGMPPHRYRKKRA